MALNVGCSDDHPCVLSAGTWALTGQYSFIEGLQITVPAGWQSLEQDAGEFNLFSLQRPTEHFFAVRDIAAVTSDGTMQQLSDVPRTFEGLTAYWRSDPNLVVSPSETTTVAGGIDATTYVVTISEDAQFSDPGCPVYPRCADMFTDPAHWEGGVYGIGAPAAVRLYFATIGSGDEQHMLVLGLEAATEDDLERLTDDVRPMIDSIRIPDPIVVW
jgi:hypothetical protein